MAFTHYSPVSINSGQVPSTQTDFPVLLDFTDNRFKTIANGGHVANSNGYDIRPYADSALTGAITGYELEKYNGSTGALLMWVKVASLSSSSTPIYLAYGDAALNTNGSSTSTWSNGFRGVYHLGDGSSLSVTDSVGNFNGTNNGATATTGEIYGGGNFVSASSQYITLGTITPFNVGTGATVSAWVNGTSFPNAYNSVILQNSINTNYFGFFVKSNGKVGWFVSNAGITQDGTGSHTLSTSTWYHLVMAYSSTTGLQCYVNGSSDVTHAANGSAPGPNAPTDIGRDAVNAGRFWNGKLDEVRMYNAFTSADWVTTEYNNQSSPPTFETLGTEVAITTGGIITLSDAGFAFASSF